jgi:hydrogenase maturation protein HypF
LQQRWCLSLSGVVQGIGLRPLLYRLSEKYHLTGWVKNTEQNTILEWQGLNQQLHCAIDELYFQLSQFGKVYFTKQLKSLEKESCFAIQSSTGCGTAHSLISPDISICKDCQNELFDPNNRRFQYPFITCALCGPRYTICEQLPYDRHHTSMAKFGMCTSCQNEYANPLDRRFHAQTISCWDCGPHIWLCDKSGHVLSKQQEVIQNTVEAILSGKIIAIKGIGGFHLMVLASNSAALKELRLRKHRPDKPFALMVKNLSQAMKICEVSALERKALNSQASPIVFLRKKKFDLCPISELVSPNQSRYGVMLAYAPIHHLLMSKLSSALVATSANVKDEPISYENDDALTSLNDIADLWLMNDRDIVHPLEDSIVNIVNDKVQFIRRARGYFPFSLPAPFTNHSRLAVGGHLKSTLALHHENRLFISPFIGDMSSVKSIDRFKQEYKNLLKICPTTTLIGDFHPDYASTQEGQKYAINTHLVQHHLAHVFAVIAEHQLTGCVLGFAWDGMGLGNGGKLWGGETFLINLSHILHVTTLKAFSLPGGEKAIKEPRRVALSLLYSLFKEKVWQHTPTHLLDCFSVNEINLIQPLIENTSLSPSCTSMGRIFDAISVLLGGVPKMTFEGQSAMYLEQLATGQSQPISAYDISIHNQNDNLLIDWRPMVDSVLNDLNLNVEKAIIAQKFHHWCSNVICKVASKFNCKQIVLSGGVFQNKLLTELSCHNLHRLGYEVYCAEQLPPNDGAISVGQALAINHLISTQSSTTLCA